MNRDLDFEHRRSSVAFVRATLLILCSAVLVCPACSYDPRQKPLRAAISSEQRVEKRSAPEGNDSRAAQPYSVLLQGESVGDGLNQLRVTTFGAKVQTLALGFVSNNSDTPISWRVMVPSDPPPWIQGERGIVAGQSSGQVSVQVDLREIQPGEYPVRLSILTGFDIATTASSGEMQAGSRREDSLSLILIKRSLAAGQCGFEASISEVKVETAQTHLQPPDQQRFLSIRQRLDPPAAGGVPAMFSEGYVPSKEGAAIAPIMGSTGSAIQLHAAVASGLSGVGVVLHSNRHPRLITDVTETVNGTTTSVVSRGFMGGEQKCVAGVEETTTTWSGTNETTGDNVFVTTRFVWTSSQ